MRVLERNSIPPAAFCQAVYRALQVGAARGSNVACVGSGGCGKSTLLESLEKIYKCAPKPEDGSTFPLGSLLGYDIMLWQDYEHDESTVRFTDLLSWFIGESVGVRVPGGFNQKVRNRAPCFYSGRGPLQLRPSARHPAEAAAQLNGMMADRFTVFVFAQPIPLNERSMCFSHCGRCAAQFFGTGGSPVQGGPLLPIAPPAPPAPSGDFMGALAELARLRASGLLDEDEFRLAKRRLLA